PNNPLQQVTWDPHGHGASTDALDNPARSLELRRAYTRLRAGLSAADWDYLMAAQAAGNKAQLADALGVSRSAVSKRLRCIHQRARAILALDC
ncbi:MAG: hypothetical protein AAFS10_25930, partial [Myxococcota bacterium]